MKRRNKLHVFGKRVNEHYNRRGALIWGYRWFWHLKSAYNGEIICAGQPRGYARKQNALDGWESVAGSAKRGVEVVESE